MPRSKIELLGDVKQSGLLGCFIDSRAMACAVAVFVCLATGCEMASHGLNAEGARYFQSGQHAAAVDRFQQAINADRRNPDSYYNLAAVYHQMARTTHDATSYSQAEHYYHQCLDFDPNHVACHRGLVVLLSEQKRTDEATKFLQEWVKASPTLADARVELARLNQEMGNRTEAEKQLVEAITIDAHNSRARAALGKIREEQGDFAQAQVNYNASLSADPVQPQVAARVAALNSAVQTQPAVGADGGTRMTTSPPPPSFR